jgi:sugar/nucleoside kinase (ribokinase family)
VSAVAVVASLSHDRIAGGPPRVGGAAYHCARALRALRADAVVVTKTSDASLADALEELGVPVRWRVSKATAAFSFEYDGETRTMAIDALGEPWSAEEARGWVADAIGAAEWVHVGPLARSDFPPGTLAELARGRRLSYDGQGLVRRARTGPLVLDPDFDPALLASVSILKLSEEEAKVVGVRHSVPEVVVTRGAKGAVVHADGEAVHVAPPRRSGADPTGAGDMFAAAYLVARADGAPPVAAAERACAVVAGLLR